MIIVFDGSFYHAVFAAVPFTGDGNDGNIIHGDVDLDDSVFILHLILSRWTLATAAAAATKITTKDFWPFNYCPFIQLVYSIN